MAAKPPIFILGVPRSGTTLLRAILDSHSAIACGPETPWLGGHQPRSLMSLWSALRDEPWGYCKSYDMPRDVPTAAAREFLSTLMTSYAAARGKKRWAEKTPDNALYVDFLRELFPEAKFVHLVRDGLDVAMSTSVVAPHRKGISEFLDSNIGFGPDAPAAPNTPFAAVLRWRHWNNLIERSLAGQASFRLSYERLVAEPEPTLRELMAFVGEPFEASMLNYAGSRHDYPAWEWGSADVQARQSISGSAVGRAKRELDPIAHEMLAPLVRASAIAPAQAMMAGDAPAALGDQYLRIAVNGFAQAMGLDGLEASQVRSIAWLWRSGLAAMDWRGKRIVAASPVSHPLPWVLAVLGARVLMRAPALPPGLAALNRGLRTEVECSSQPLFGMQGAVALGCSEPVPGALDKGAAVFIVGHEAVASWRGTPGMGAPPGGLESAEAAVLLRG